MSTFPVFIFFRCLVVSICLLHATLFTQFGITNLELPLMEDMCVHCIETSLAFMPEIQSGIALGTDWGRRRNREECVCVCVCVCACALPSPDTSKRYARLLDGHFQEVLC